MYSLPNVDFKVLLQFLRVSKMWQFSGHSLHGPLFIEPHHMASFLTLICKSDLARPITQHKNYSGKRLRTVTLRNHVTVPVTGK